MCCYSFRVMVTNVSDNFRCLLSSTRITPTTKIVKENHQSIGAIGPRYSGRQRPRKLR
jgi:hypothetical protein